MTLRPFWRYYGGKWRAAPRYPRPQRDTIVEPFAGAAGYATRYHDRRVVLVDKSPIIAGIWRYLIAVKPSEVLAIPSVPDGGTVDDLLVCQEARWLVGFWLNGGSDHPGKTPSAWARQHGDGVHWLGWSNKARDRIASQVDAIRHWRIIEGNYTDAPDVDATWFVDPPYQTAAGRHYREQPDDFDALGAWTLARRGQIIACDQVGADWLPWSSDMKLKGTSGARRAGTSAEIVYHRPAPFTLTPT